MVMQTKDFSLSQNSQKELLSAARTVIKEYLTSGDVKDFSFDKDSELTQFAAVFVTLTQKGMLRGCIGITEPEYPLCEAVIRMALAAAFNDGRFFPLTIDELAYTKIEISVLSPSVKIKNVDDIIPDKHGVIINKNGRCGLFLPQVWEHFSGKDRKADFLKELCMQKAGIEENAWQDKNTDIFVFTVFSFKEEE